MKRYYVWDETLDFGYEEPCESLQEAQDFMDELIEINRDIDGSTHEFSIYVFE